MPHPSRPLVVVLAVTVGALLSACGPESPPAPAQTSQTSQTSQTVTVRDDAVTASVTPPDGWVHTGKDTPLVVQTKTPYGAPGFTANVVVTTSTPGSATLADRTAEAADALRATDGVTVDPPQPEAITVSGLPAHRIVATRSVDGTPVTQVETIIEVANPVGTVFVYVTESSASDDAEGAAQARAVTDSLVVTAAD